MSRTRSWARGIATVLPATTALALLTLPIRPLLAEGARGTVAQAQPSAQPNGALSTEVMILHATNQPNGGTGIDPRIGSLPALRQPPFSSYNSYQLISRDRYPLTKSTPAASTLPNDRVLQITVREILGTRYRVATSINQPGGTTFLPLLEVTTPANEPFFVAGQSYKGGMLVIGITIVP